jgi:hypothetical protein
VAVTVSTFATNRRLTTKDSIKDLLGITTVTDDVLFDDLIDRASDTIKQFAGRTFERQAYSETFKGFDTVNVVLTHTPVVGTPTITFEGDSVTDFSVENPGAGILYRKRGWVWTAVLAANTFIDQAMPDSEDPTKWVATYTAGYLLPDDNYSAITISVDDTDDSFNDSASAFPLLGAQDRIKVSGFSDAANNGTFTVVSRTAAKVVVSESLTTEAAGDQVTMDVGNLPKDIRKAAEETVKSWYRQRKGDPAVVSKRVGDLSIEYGDEGPESLPPKAIWLLQPYVNLGVL